ncbi:CPBP family intramembrane metalloprotease [Ancylothrix sp. C2]|uniref:CPBP family intramembrane glutamic endopeptidase n=1 Tax=Ancylothrix sp. D3o TaxID=2953691 RepID=UPI0021BA4058|nr:type II CAAX endopeptidase family protein [Ancylothrix sp. D3o]MCT7950468.1 CPBP family intramembrane metalloprotease [Ancylothrix sp. D3o]
MTIKRIILTILTVLTLGLVSFSLIESWNEPQIQSRLELYQTNLILHAAEWKGENLEGADIATAKQTLLGDDLFGSALKQYQEASESGEKNLQKTRQQLQTLKPASTEMPEQPTTATEQKKLLSILNQQQNSLDEIDLRLGILQLKNNQKDKAIQSWQNIVKYASNETIERPVVQTAQVLENLANSRIFPETESVIKQNLDGWFRYQALSEYYQIKKDTTSLATLEANEQKIAEQAVIKLGIIGIVPTIGFIGGTGLLIGLLIQQLIKGKQAVLATNGDVAWETPWDWEIIWQVLVGGFFFISQIAAPLLLQTINALLKINPGTFDVRGKAIYILFTYIVLAAGGILAIYFSVKPFTPLPKDWFRIDLKGKWFFWGLGGYLAALPLVVLVSLINQKIWQGQGGSNAILPIALESKDAVALTIFFLTASIGAPIFEEIMFRGFLLPSLTRYMPVWGAIVLSGLIFAVAHLNVSEVLPLATLGIILGFVYSRSRNLLASMFLHSLWNSGTLLSLYVLGSAAN